MRAVLVAALIAGCAGRQTPSVERLVARVGVEGARAELRFRVASHPSDLDARRALAVLEDAHGRPGAALAELLVVERAGGPIGTRWARDDRDRLARLLLARARARLARGAAPVTADLDHARRLGARVPAALRADAERVEAELALRHAAQAVRAPALARLVAAAPRGGDPRAVVGRRAWAIGARRAARDLLEAWYADGGRDPAALAVLARARRWWSVPGDAPFTADARDAALAAGGAVAPAAADAPLGVPCLPVATPDDPACSPLAAAATASADGAAWEPDLVATSRGWSPTRDPATAAAWVVVTLRAALRDPEDDQSWLGAIRARADVAATVDAAPAWARPTLLRAAGRAEDAARGLAAVVGTDLAAGPRLVVAAELAMAGDAAAARALLAPIAETAAGRELAARIDPPAVTPIATRAETVAAAAAARAGAARLAAPLAAIARGYATDPAVADRELAATVDGEVDAAVGLVAGAALMSGLGDTARARALWQRAAEAAPEPSTLWSLALAVARAGDPDAALLDLTRAAAAWGDAAPVLVSGARALLDAGAAYHAIEAGKQAIDLAGPDAIAAALAVTAAASRAAGRDAQAAELDARRVALIAPDPVDRDAVADPTDLAAALAAAGTGAASLDRLARAAAWHPRDAASRRVLAGLPANDPRGDRARAELAGLAADPDPGRAAAALAAIAAITALGP